MTFVLYNELSEEDFLANKIRLEDEFEDLLVEDSETLGFVPVIIHSTMMKEIQTLTINDKGYCSVVEDANKFSIVFTYKSRKQQAEFTYDILMKLLEGYTLFLFTTSYNNFTVIPVMR